jgi:light-regulated signal transduction histidine kinase (bacteriophytochrome)
LILDEHSAQLTDEGRAYLGRVRAAAQRMSALIDDMLKLSRVTRAELHYEDVDLSAMVREIVTQLQRQDPKRGVDVVIANDVSVRGDARLLHIVLENLLANAWKFTAGRATSRIDFGVTDTERGRAFFVRDDGAGFDMAYQDKLFNVFQRLHDAREYPGTGIGLAIVQRVIHRHGGSVWAEGHVGQGAAFYFMLP